MAELKNIVLVALCLITLIFLAASCGGNQWVKIGGVIDFVNTIGEGGIWTYCKERTFVYVKNCVKYEGLLLPDWLQATQAFSIFAVLFSGGALGMAVLTLFTEKIKIKHVAILLIIPGVCGIIALAIFTSKLGEHPEIAYLKRYGISPSFGWSYALGWVGSILSLLSAVVGIAMKTIDTMRNR